MKTVLHRDGGQFAIVTTAESEPDFRKQFADAITDALEDSDERSFVIEQWFAPAVEIVCRYRGYKSQVIEQRTLIAGHIDPDAVVTQVSYPGLAIAE